MKKVKLKKEMFGDEWPFIPETVVVGIRKEVAVVIHDGITYNLNGHAENQNIGHSISPIWAPHEEIPGLRKSINPIFEYLGI